MSLNKTERTGSSGTTGGGAGWHSSVNGHAQAFVIVASGLPAITSRQQPQQRRA